MAKKTTRERLIDAGCRVFAEKGYDSATVSDICEKAGANIASINYHFGDKESLYDAVWRHAFSITSKTYPIDGNLPENPTLEDALYAYISAILHRIFCEGEAGLFPRLLSQEMASPTLALEQIADDALFPQGEFLKTHLISFFGEQIDEQTLRQSMHSIIGQCVFFNFSRGLRRQLLGKTTMNEKDIEQHARHIARFSMGGLKEIKNENTL